ncbi:hypothetical protein LBMAG33_7230 [Candidatus Levyibacteriota bacterium]|nr:hypothetical protein LBMAG33_7230 [Candidatus Levybacteria bacterium]
MNKEQEFFSLNLDSIQDKNKVTENDQGENIISMHNYGIIRKWMKSLTSGERIEFNLQKKRVLKLIGLESRRGLSDWLQEFNNDEDFRKSIYDNANERIAKNYNIPITEITSTFERYAEGSNQSIVVPMEKMPKFISGMFEMANEIELASHPVDLLSIAFNPEVSNKYNFEAMRKLGHMEDAAIIERDPLLIKKREEMIKFTNILNEYLWIEGKSEINQNVYFLSTHDIKNEFECLGVEVMELSFEEADYIYDNLPIDQKLVVVSRRKFSVKEGPEKGRIIDVYISNRLKTPHDRRVKSERKNNGGDSGSYTKDTIGVRVVANDKKDLLLFIDQLCLASDEVGSDVKIYDIKDSIGNNNFEGDNLGSSKDIQMIKFLVRISGIELEMQAFEHIGFANYSFKRGSSHPEYYWNRLFKSNWFEKNFPTNLYNNYDCNLLLKRLISNERELIEGEPAVMPENTNESNDGFQIFPNNEPDEPSISTYLNRLMSKIEAIRKKNIGY